MKPKMKALVCDPIHQDGIERLKLAGFTVDVKPSISDEELKNLVSTYDVLVVRSRTKITAEVIGKGRRLKAVGRAGVGLENIDVDAAKKRNIAVFNSPEAPAEAVAELTIGLLISIVRRLPFADRTMKEGQWTKKQLMGWQLEGKTLGMLGLGNIGKRVAKIAKALGMKILITKRTPPDPELLSELVGEYVPLRELLMRSDVVTIHVPLTHQTRHMIGREELGLMKDGSYMINTARGPVVDEKALADALRSGKLAGAALDVYAVEPPQDLELVTLRNVVCTPHIGGQTEESQRGAATIIADKIIAHLKKA
ncbi:MAG: D-2-hydroxyacid dehydrogenase [Candidatus Bathyarchaeota archaeon]|nr:D-2-hydroxyacid dehydrogenase [Candidatus Bathyarchaeota archaeon]